MDKAIELDLRNLKCPLPVLRTRKALERAAPGTTIVVIATDPMSVIDIPHCVQADGHRLTAQDRIPQGWRFTIISRSG